MSDRCYEHGTDECLGCIQELKAEVERLQKELANTVSPYAASRLAEENERLRADLKGGRAQAIEQRDRAEAHVAFLELVKLGLHDRVAELEAEVKRLRGKQRQVEEVLKVVEDTRFASPPMDASECAVLLHRALAEEEE